MYRLKNGEVKMRLHVLSAIALMLLGVQTAAAAPATGHGALALAAILGDHSPLLKYHQRRALARILDDKAPGPGSRAKIIVDANVVSCRAGDVDIAAFSCALTFGKRNVTLAGRHANELFATLIEAGVQSDGAAGTIYEAVHALKCTIDPVVVAQKSGAGAECDYVLGPS